MAAQDVKPDLRHEPATTAAAPKPAGTTPLVELAAVGKTYAARDGSPVQAIAAVSATVSAGEFVSILGPSGCGKSTLLMMIGGLLRPSSGRILYRGNELTSPQPDVGVVFQDPVLFPWRTVLENVELPGEVTNIPPPQRRDRARALIALVRLQGFEAKYPAELSGGMQQRVAIARALMLNPSLLLMDEPFGALDALTREQMNLELQRISMESKATVLFVTHSIPEAAFLGNRVFVMSGRPSTVKEIVAIDIPRPRPIDLMASDRFGTYVAHLRRLLDVTGDAS